MPDFLPEVLGPALQARRRALYDHPLWRAIEDGSASLAQLRTFAVQDGWLVGHSRQLEALLIAHAPDEQARATLLTKQQPKAVFAAEGDIRHFGEGVGLSASDFDDAVPLAGCAALTSHFYYMLARHGFLGMLASVSVSESVFIAVCLRITPALQHHYGLTDRQVAFFPLHDRLEEGVNTGEAELIARLCSTQEARSVVRLAATQTYAAEELFYDTVYAAR
ncbi:iron-containing redox enzyme family protein [Deinococcus altitudinis]|uniref:iron-containing redox enzyme family protein n=1 Tax=Deinococcus altitudinis TaxID=468914 RepID=UPI0038918303